MREGPTTGLAPCPDKLSGTARGALTILSQRSQAVIMPLKMTQSRSVHIRPHPRSNEGFASGILKVPGLLAVEPALHVHRTSLARSPRERARCLRHASRSKLLPSDVERIKGHVRGHRHTLAVIRTEKAPEEVDDLSRDAAKAIEPSVVRKRASPLPTSDLQN